MGDLAGAAIPVPAVGLGASVATAIARAGIKLSYGAIIARTAMELHWRAKVELALAGLGGGSGSVAKDPASAVLFESFKKRGVTRRNELTQPDRSDDSVAADIAKLIVAPTSASSNKHSWANEFI